MPSKSERWRQSLDAQVGKLSLEATLRNALGASLYHLGHQHYNSFVDLFSKGLFGSAFALVRSQMEAVVRASWVVYCASDDELNGIKAGKDFPKISPMLEALIEAKGDPFGEFDSFKKSVWKILNDFTHGGAAQITNHISTKSIGTPRYSSAQKAKVKDIADSLSWFNGVGLAELCGDEKVVRKMMMSHKKIFQKAT